MTGSFVRLHSKNVNEINEMNFELSVFLFPLGTLASPHCFYLILFNIMFILISCFGCVDAEPNV